MKRLNLLLLALMFSVLTACGGGSDGYGNGNGNGNGNDNGNGNGTPPPGDIGGGSNLSVSLVLLNQGEQPTTSISSTEPGILQATVTRGGSPLGSTVVTFSTDLGTLEPKAGTSLTGPNGVASILLHHGGSDGAGTAKAAITVDTESASASTSFSATSTNVTTTIDMGHGTGNAFVPDVIDLGTNTTLSAGGTLTATVSIVETSNNNVPYTPQASVTFESPCSLSGKATLDSPKTTATGIASSTYTAKGCVGTDIITARTTIGGTPYTATGTVQVLPATVGSIQFESASHDVIAIQGTGGASLSETSTVIFTVFDDQGIPVSGQQVNFGLSTTLGGITLYPASGTTNDLGRVQTVVNSGTVNTSVQVTAAVAGTGISTNSVALAISTGRPDQNSFSIAMQTLNPKTWETNGVVVPVTIYVADHFNNPAPNGTAIAFRTEGGFIDGSCITQNGQCTVNWLSTDPRPADGRVTILATAIGEEGFTDVNSNGRYDDGEPFTDLPDAFLDANESGSYEFPEEFADFNGDGYSDVNFLYNGTLCAEGAINCDNGKLVYVRSSGVLVMASRTQLVKVFDTRNTPSTSDDIDVTAGGLKIKDNGEITQIRVDVMDARGQMPPVTTTVAVTVDTTFAKLLGGTGAGKGVVPNTSSPGPFSVTANLQVQAVGAGTGSDVVTITLGIPGEASSTVSIPIDRVDVTGPTVTQVTPAFAAQNVARDATISATFSEAMKASSVTTTGNITINPALAGNWQYDPSQRKATFLPSGIMAATTTYTVTVGTNVVDSAGNPINSVNGDGGAPQEWAFKTTGP